MGLIVAVLLGEYQLPTKSLLGCCVSPCAPRTRLGGKPKLTVLGSGGHGG